MRAQMGDTGVSYPRRQSQDPSVMSPSGSMGPPPLPHAHSSSQQYRQPLPASPSMYGRPSMPPPPPPVNADLRPRTPEPPHQPTKLVAAPPVRPSSSRPLPSPISTSTPSTNEAGPSTPRTPRSAASAFSPVSPSVLDRSDTVSSVKSLDRAQGFGSPSKRPLPKPPVAVNTSKSLDRGIPSGIGGFSTAIGPAEGYKKAGRKLPSTVTEISEGSEDGMALDMSRLSMGRSPSPTKRPASPVKSQSAPAMPVIFAPTQGTAPGTNEPPISPARSATRNGSVNAVPTIVAPPVIVEPPSISVTSDDMQPPIIVEPPSITVDSSPTQPATFTPLPSINIGCESDDEDTATPGSGIVYGGLPVIAVSSSDASEEPRKGDPSQRPAGNTSNGRSAHPSSRSPHGQGPTRLDPTTAIICAGCTSPIIGRIVSAMDQRWHPQCFTCGECGELLEHVSSYEYNGKPYCHLDYHDVSTSISSPAAPRTDCQEICASLPPLQNTDRRAPLHHIR